MDTHALIAIGIMAVVTYLLRAVPFVIFKSKATPAYVSYLGKYLPYAAMAMLVVYCLKDIQFLTGMHGVPEVISVIAVVLLHIWKKNTVLSVVVGTACYMILIRLMA